MSKSSELDKTAKRYIINHISDDGYATTSMITDKEKIQFLQETFQAEYGWHIKQVGEQNALREYFMGLPTVCTVDFENYEILKLAVKWGSLPENYTERQGDRILENWFNFVAAKTGQLFRGYRLPQ